MKFIELIKTIVNEQKVSYNRQFTVGDVFEGTRDRDDKGLYTIKIMDILSNNTEGFITVFSKTGKGKYGTEILKAQENHKVRFRDKKIEGNNQLGTFFNLKKISGSDASSTTSQRDYGGGKVDKNKQDDLGGGKVDKNKQDDLGGGKVDKNKQDDLGGGKATKTRDF